jgi:hypothetical protein
VAFESDDQEVRIRRVKDVDADRADRIRALRGAWSKGGAGTDALLAERLKERELEERRAEGRGVGRL